MLVRRADIADRDRARTIVDEYADLIGVVMRDDRTSFEAYFAPQQGLWLAEIGDLVVGCVALRALPAVAPDAAEVKRLYVRGAFRKRGVAEALMDALEAWASTAGYRTLYLDSHDGLPNAIRFYRNRGYEPVPRYNENSQATVFLARSLSTV